MKKALVPIIADYVNRYYSKQKDSFLGSQTKSTHHTIEVKVKHLVKDPTKHSTKSKEICVW